MTQPFWHPGVAACQGACAAGYCSIASFLLAGPAFLSYDAFLTSAPMDTRLPSMRTSMSSFLPS